MMNRFWGKTSTILSMVLSASLAGCGSETPTCAASNMVWGACAGVPAGDVCSDDSCTGGVHCGSIIDVESDAELASAAGSAHAGACIALSPGHYGGVELPGGVSLLGRSFEEVSIDSVTMKAGAGGVLRGLAVGAGGVTVMGATGVRIESVKVSGGGAVRDGITLDPGSSATIVTSTIEGAGRVGVFARDTELTIDRSIVSGAQAGGIWAQSSSCDAACACAALPHLTVTESAIRDNHVLGVSTQGMAANLERVDVTGTKAGESFKAGQLGGGMSVSGCSELAAQHLRVLDNAYFFAKSLWYS